MFVSASSLACFFIACFCASKSALILASFFSLPSSIRATSSCLVFQLQRKKLFV
ncbi:membrane or secreted protein [gut metagenome]|uniref:Membrane or secreted protein n=1 Tax=gut metagenome TaxID=749906 RepID=J9H4L4_9ZZZZ